MLSTRDVPNNKKQNSYMNFVIFIDLFLFHDDDAKYCWKRSAFALLGIFRPSFAAKNLVRIRFPGVIKPFLQITSKKLSVVDHVLTEIYVLLTRKRLFETNFIDEYSLKPSRQEFFESKKSSTLFIINSSTYQVNQILGLYTTGKTFP